MGCRSVGLDFQSDLKVSSIESQPPAPILQGMGAGSVGEQRSIFINILILRSIGMKNRTVKDVVLCTR